MPVKGANHAKNFYLAAKSCLDIVLEKWTGCRYYLRKALRA